MHFSGIIGHILLCMRRNCYFRAFGKNSNIAIKVIDPDFLKGISNLAITFPVFISWYTLKICHISIFGLFDLMTLNTSHISYTAVGEFSPGLTFELNQPIRPGHEFLLLTHYVML